MTIADKVKSVLSDVRVLDTAIDCLRDDIAMHFLVHLADDGKITIGTPLYVDDERAAEIKSEAIRLDRWWGDIGPWMRYSLAELEDMKMGYGIENGDIPRTGLVVLTRWVKDISPEAWEYLEKILAPNNPSNLLSCLRLTDYIQLNQMTMEHGSVAYVRGEMLHPEYVSLTATQQKVPRMSADDFEMAAKLGLLRFSGHPLGKLYNKYYYTTMRGMIKLPERTVQMDCELDRMVGGAGHQL